MRGYLAVRIETGLAHVWSQVSAGSVHFLCFGAGSFHDRRWGHEILFNEINMLEGARDADWGHFSISIHTSSAS